MTLYLSQQLHVHLGNTIYGIWTHDGEVRGGVLGGRGTKCSYGTRAEQLDPVLLSHLEYVVEAIHSELNVCLHRMYVGVKLLDLWRQMESSVTCRAFCGFCSPMAERSAA